MLAPHQGFYNLAASCRDAVHTSPLNNGNVFIGDGLPARQQRRALGKLRQLLRQPSWSLRLRDVDYVLCAPVPGSLGPRHHDKLRKRGDPAPKLFRQRGLLLWQGVEQCCDRLGVYFEGWRASRSSKCL